MKKTKHFNISVPELGDVPDITQVSNAISDLEDATAGTLEIMKAEMQGTKITLTSVSRKTKRTGYYEGMSIRFKSPQDIEPNYLKTISVDDLGDQELSVAYKVNRNEYIDIVYEGNKFTAYPVVVQKTDSVSNNSSILVGTAKGVKTAYDKGVEALNKANQAQTTADNAQSTADGKVSKSGDTMTGPLIIDAWNNNLKLYSKGVRTGEVIVDGGGIAVWNATSRNALKLRNNGDASLHANNLTTTNKEVVSAINELNSGKENKIDKKTGFNLDKSDSIASNSSSTLATAKAVKTAYDKASQAQSTADGKVSKSGDTMSGILTITTDTDRRVIMYRGGDEKGSLCCFTNSVGIFNTETRKNMRLFDNGDAQIDASNLNTSSKEVIGAINELNSGKVSKSGGEMEGPLAFDNSNFSKQHQFVGYRGADNDLNERVHENEMGWSYTGVLQKDDIVHGFPMYNNANGLLSFNTHNGSYGHQIGMSSDGRLYHRYINGGVTSNWKTIFESDSCPYDIGDIYITTNSGNPATTWLGTTWEKIEGRFLLGSSGDASAGTTGGSMSKTISVANLPSHNHSGSQSEHSHYMFSDTSGGSHITASNVKEKAPSYKAVLRTTTDRDDYVIAGNNGSAAYGRTSDAGGEVSVGYTGSGSALDITPSYYTVHIWKRRG